MLEVEEEVGGGWGAGSAGARFGCPLLIPSLSFGDGGRAAALCLFTSVAGMCIVAARSGLCPTLYHISSTPTTLIVVIAARARIDS